MTTDIALRRDPYEWTDNLPAVGDLANRIAGTEFVPAGLRGKPAAVAACVLYGAEIGIGPMKSLAGIHVVDGRPAMSAELMRALVLAAGHSIRVQELTSTRCVLIGTRRGDADGTTITYSVDDAKRAGVAGKKVWQQYPREMLLARATTSLCRAVFADVIGGMASLEEAQDGAAEAAAGPAPTRRVARRRTVTPAPPTVEPELDDEVVDTVTGEIVDAEIVEDPDEGDEVGATKRQLTAMGAAFSAIGWTDRADRLRATSAIVGRQVESAKSLTRDEASTLLDTLTFLQRADDPQGRLTALMEAHAAEGVS